MVTTVALHRTETLDYLSPTGFKFLIQRLPTTTFFLQEANVPGLSLGVAMVPSPLIDVPYAGDHIEVEEFTVKFVVDEKVRNWDELRLWSRGLGFPVDYSQYHALETQPPASGNGIFSDITLTILDAKKRPTLDVVFHDAFPVRLTGFVMATDVNDIVYITSTATFKYTDFEINRQGETES